MILAGVSISLVVDNNGIIKRSKEARSKYGESKDNEQAQLGGVSDWIDKQANENGGGPTILPDATEETKPYLPSGFTKDEDTDLDNGLVISDSTGNEYVWVEVPTSIYDNADYNTETNTGDKKPTGKDDTNKIEYCLKKYASAYRRNGFADEYVEDEKPGWFAGKTEYDNAKKKMLASVYENGGFYVGRYEAGISEFRTSNENEPTEVPVSKQNMFPYTVVTRTQAKQLAEKVNAGGCTSSLMYGIQWDLMLVFIQNKGGVDVSTLTTDSTKIGNYNNNKWSITNNKAKYSTDGLSWNDGSYAKEEESAVLLTTGASNTFAKMNIYDVAGNVREWTLEGYKRDGSLGSQGIKLASLINTQINPIRMSAIIIPIGPWVSRGGDFKDDGTNSQASYRLSIGLYGNSDGFRVTLY